MFYEFRTGYYHKWWKKVPPNKHWPIRESMIKQYFTQQSPLVISKLWSITMEETCPFRSWNVVVLLMSIIHRKSTQIKKTTSNTTKKMTRVIISNSRLLKFKIITESMISMITIWNGVTQILLLYAAEQTMNLSVYLKQIMFKTIQLLTKSEFFRSLNVWN